LERLGGNPQFFPDLAKGETAATEVQRRWNAEGARNAPIAKSLEKQGLETSECKEACHPVNGYQKSFLGSPILVNLTHLPTSSFSDRTNNSFDLGAFGVLLSLFTTLAVRMCPGRSDN
jgi:hypothetical protein